MISIKKVLIKMRCKVTKKKIKTTKVIKKKKVIKTNNSEILKLNGRISALQNQKESIEDRIQEVKGLEEQSKLFDFIAL